MSLDNRASQQLESYLRQVASDTRPGDFRAPLSLRDALTSREREVLEVLARGTHIDLAAHELGVAVSTIRNHVKNIHAKLRIHSTAGAIARYLLEASGGATPPSEGDSAGPAGDTGSAPGVRARPARGEIPCRSATCPLGDVRERDLGRCAHVARALAHPTRLKLLGMLSRGERRNFELAAELGIAASSVSRHLAVLAAVNLVSVRHDGSVTWFGSRCPLAPDAWMRFEDPAGSVEPPPCPSI